MTDPPPGRQERSELFIHLMQSYGNDVLRICYVLLRDRMLAEDAMQEVFLKVYRHLDTPPQNERAYLMTIAVNTCRDIRRSAWLRHNDQRVSLDDLPPAACDFTSEDDSILCEVMALKPAYREAILLRYYQELEPEVCAQALGLSPSGFYRRLRRALAALKPRLERWGLNE